MFLIVPIFIGIIFVIVFGSIIFSVFKGVAQWRKNEQSPKLSVPAIVKSKRENVSRRSSEHRHGTYTNYFVTFEFESEDRSEFQISGKEYGLLSENDNGMLTFQGSRYLGFERKKVSN
ncbi:DUF2500 domain-containing protein [Bacillus spongiae]